MGRVRKSPETRQARRINGHGSREVLADFLPGKRSVPNSQLSDVALKVRILLEPKNASADPKWELFQFKCRRIGRCSGNGLAVGVNCVNSVGRLPYCGEMCPFANGQGRAELSSFI